MRLNSKNSEPKKTIDKSNLEIKFVNSRFSEAKKIIGTLYRKNKWILVIQLILSLLLSFLFIGFFIGLGLKAERIIYDLDWLTAVYLGFTQGFVVSILACVGLNYLFYRIIRMFTSTKDTDVERNYDVSKSGYYGTADKMTQAEKEIALNVGTYATQKDNIVGCEPKQPDKLYSVKINTGDNGNKVIVGSPGSGKTVCESIPTIMQSIRRGESVIASDPKGELYRMTAAMAKANGYIVKIFNVHPKRILHSDACSFMSIITDDLTAQSFTSTIMENLIVGDPDFWTDSARNELTFAALYIANNKEGLDKTLGGIYNFLNNNSVKDLEIIFDNLPPSHPSKPFFNTWNSGTPIVKESTHGGLQIHLQKLANKIINEITGHDEIDLVLPGKEKCIYYIAMSDQDKSMKFLIALFFTLLFQELVEYADSFGEKGVLPVKVTVLLDEFYSMGKIPDFDTRLSNMRGRGINCIIIIQSLGQLQEMYPNGLWESILDCCSTWILLRTQSKTTAEYFSFRSGVQTVEDKSKRYDDHEGNIMNVHSRYSLSESHNARPVFTPDEIIRLNPDNLFFVKAGCNVCELEKVPFWNHPMCKEMREINASRHLPEWVKNLNTKKRIELGIDNELYSPEGPFNIELCTEEDFLESWNPEKEALLQKEILEFDKKIKEIRLRQRGKRLNQ